MIATSIRPPADRVITFLPSLLDPKMVLDACRDNLNRIDSATRQSWQSARMIEALYHPERYIRVVYALVSDLETESSRYWPEGQLVYLSAPVREPMSRRGEVLQIGDAEVEAYAFPNDRRLRGLRTFAKRELCAQNWQGWVRETGSNDILQVESLQRLLVRYVPEQKWTVRLRGEWLDEETGVSKKRRIAVRASSIESCSKLVHRHDFLTSGNSEQVDGFVIPKVVGASISRGLLAVEWLRGETILPMLAKGDGKDCLSNIAQCLHRFHRTEVPGLPEITSSDLLERIDSAVVDLSLANPDWRASLSELGRRTTAAIQKLEQATMRTLHNDLHWKQFTFKRGRITLLDLERMADGDPLLDVANFATQLQMLGHRTDCEIDPQMSKSWHDTFIDLWYKVEGTSVDRRRLAIYSAISSLELARGFMRHLKHDWHSVGDACIELANAGLSEADV